MRMMLMSSVLAVLLLISLASFAQTTDPLQMAAAQVTEALVRASASTSGPIVALETSIRPPLVYVALGSGQGILQGTVFDLVSKGDPIVVQGEVLGYREKPAGSAEVQRVQNERLSVAEITETVPDTSLRIGDLAYVKGVPGTLALSAFTRPDGAMTQLGQEFADKLGTTMQNSGRFQMVERARFEQVLAELQLSFDDLFDQEKVAQLGNQLQARGLVLGTVTQQNDRYVLAVRVVDIETGAQTASTDVTCGRSTELDTKYAQVLGVSPPSGTRQSDPVEQTQARIVFEKVTKDELRGDISGELLTKDGQLYRLYDPTIGGVYWSEGIALDYSANEIVVVLNGQWRKLVLEVGIRDPSRGDSHRELEFLADGQRIDALRLTGRTKPVRREYDVTGVQAFTIRTAYGNDITFSADTRLLP